MLNPSLPKRGWRVSLSEWVQRFGSHMCGGTFCKSDAPNLQKGMKLKHTLQALQIVLVTNPVLHSHTAPGTWCFLLGHEFLVYGQVSQSQTLYHFNSVWVWLWVRIWFHTCSLVVCLCQYWTPHKIPGKWCANSNRGKLAGRFHDSRTYLPQKN